MLHRPEARTECQRRPPATENPSHRLFRVPDCLFWSAAGRGTRGPTHRPRVRVGRASECPSTGTIRLGRDVTLAVRMTPFHTLRNVPGLVKGGGLMHVEDQYLDHAIA